MNRLNNHDAKKGINKRWYYAKSTFLPYEKPRASNYKISILNIL